MLVPAFGKWALLSAFQCKQIVSSALPYMQQLKEGAC